MTTSEAVSEWRILKDLSGVPPVKVYDRAATAVLMAQFENVPLESIVTNPIELEQLLRHNRSLAETFEAWNDETDFD